MRLFVRTKHSSRCGGTIRAKNHYDEYCVLFCKFPILVYMMELFESTNTVSHSRGKKKIVTEILPQHVLVFSDIPKKTKQR
jgi:hypothetical protein